MITNDLRRAISADVPALIDLHDQTGKWLGEAKHTDQWVNPWPTREGRDHRIARGVERGHTWILEAAGVLAGTVTLCREGNDNAYDLWRPEELAEPAVYLSRLIVGRRFAGQGAGAALIDWVGQRGDREWQARWVRIDVWSDNHDLHAYYKSQGFEYLRTYESPREPKYPSGALFQKPVASIDPSSAARFRVGEALLKGAPALA